MWWWLAGAAALAVGALLGDDDDNKSSSNRSEHEERQKEKERHNKQIWSEINKYESGEIRRLEQKYGVNNLSIKSSNFVNNKLKNLKDKKRSLQQEIQELERIKNA